MGDRSPERVPPLARRRLRWGPVAGLVVFAYAIWAAIDLVVAGVSRGAFTRLHSLYDSVGVRLVLSVVVVAALFHSLDGLRRMLEELRPGVAAHERVGRAAVAFVTAALAMPAVALVLWPSVQGWLR
ncbi:MAG: hypothetical protein R2726_23065 [Acidimicrobiales bacterium]